MPQSAPEILEQVTYAGSLSMRALLALGVAMLVVSAALLWRETRQSRPAVGVLLWLLRAAALAIVVYMLAGPSLRTRVRNTQAKSFALLVDRSGSMRIPDGDERLEREPTELRWLLHAVHLDPPAASQLDSAAASLRLAASLAGLPASGKNSDAAGQIPAMIDAGSKDLRKAADADAHVATQAETIRTELNPLITSTSSPPNGRTDDRAPKIKALADRVSQLADTCVVDAFKALRAEDQDRLRAQAARTRSDLAGDWLKNDAASPLAAIEKQTRVRTYAFDSTVAPVAGDWPKALAGSDGSSGTDLTAALTQLAQDSATEPLAGAIVLTDGGHNTSTDPTKTASQLGRLPLYIVPVGRTGAMRDVLIHHVQAPRGVFKNDNILIDGVVDAHGCNGEEITIELRQGDTTLASQRLPVVADNYTHAFSFRRQAEQVGMQHFTVRALPLPDERVQDNNQEQLTVEVTEDKIRLLLADHLPRWEHRYLRNLFKRDNRVEMDELLFEPRRSGGEPSTGEGWPADLDAWSRYRVVILGDVRPSELDAPEQVLLEKYVRERGGILIIMAGEGSARDGEELPMPAAFAHTPLERLLPVELSDLPASIDAGFGLYVTPEGAQSAVLQLVDDSAASERLWREQVTLHRISTYAKPRQIAHVWLGAAPLDATTSMNRPEQAFLCWQEYGDGRVVYFSAPMTYRLRFREGDTYHHRFWGQLLRWAIARDVSSGSLTVHLTTDKTRYKAGEPIRVSARLNQLQGDAVAGANITVIAEQDHHAAAQIQLKEEAANPGHYSGTMQSLPTGSVHLRVQGPEVDALLKTENRTEPVETVVVIDPIDDVEMRNTQCNLALLHQIAEATGGQVLTPAAALSVLSQIDLSPEVSEQVSERPLWSQWRYLWIFVGCLTAEWVIRKLTGMA